MNIIPRAFRAAALAAAMLAAGAAHAIELGVDYALVPEPSEQPLPDAEISVTEFFNFSCPACNATQPLIETWLVDIPDNVVWQRHPVPFQRAGALYARLFFVLEGFEKDEELFGDVFKALHQERKLLNSVGRIIDWLVEEHGFEEEATEAAFDSFSVNTKLRRTVRLLQRFGVDSTPTFIVADRYIILRPTGTSHDKMLENVTELIELIRAGEAG